ncbi:MAG: epoxyqueuosine reductase QueH [Candidatus Pacebacteria bacterium]|nr:epoxyqueuosine reductase QueH [Candidatus Paceibacterota bacterium]
MLLHTCCAPCALPIIEYLLEDKKVKNLTLYFYNPNIYPQQEYQKRLKQAEKIAKIYNLELKVGDYERNKWLNYLEKSLPNSLESYAENEERCLACFRFRLDKTAEFAKNNNFNEFTTTLSVNRFKDTAFINNYGKKLAKKNGLNYAILNLDPYKAHKKEQELVKIYNLYSQKYCGCEFS